MAQEGPTTGACDPSHVPLPRFEEHSKVGYWLHLYQHFWAIKILH